MADVMLMVPPRTALSLVGLCKAAENVQSFVIRSSASDRWKNTRIQWIIICSRNGFDSFYHHAAYWWNVKWISCWSELIFQCCSHNIFFIWSELTAGATWHHCEYSTKIVHGMHGDWDKQYTWIQKNNCTAHLPQ